MHQPLKHLFEFSRLISYSLTGTRTSLKSVYLVTGWHGSMSINWRCTAHHHPGEHGELEHFGFSWFQTYSTGTGTELWNFYVEPVPSLVSRTWQPDNIDYGRRREEGAAEEGASDGGRREVAETWQRLAEVGQRRVPDAGAVQIGHRCRRWPGAHHRKRKHLSCLATDSGYSCIP